MAGGKHRHHPNAQVESHGFGRRLRRGVALTPDERELAARLRTRCRMPWDSVARAVGRTVAELRAELDPTYAKG